MDENGRIQANEMGESYVNATLTYKGTEYFEYFKITVPVELDKLSLDKSKIMLLPASDISAAIVRVVVKTGNHKDKF